MTQEKLPHRKELCLQSEIPDADAPGIFLFFFLIDDYFKILI